MSFPQMLIAHVLKYIVFWVEWSEQEVRLKINSQDAESGGGEWGENRWTWKPSPAGICEGQRKDGQGSSWALR